MNPPSRLADWGEPPASPQEVAWAEFLDSLLQEIEGGQPPGTRVVPGGGREAAERSRQLLEGLLAMSRCSSSLGARPPGGSASSRTGTPPQPFPGEFRVIRELGRGGFGTVWLAEDLRLGRLVALKAVDAPQGSGRGAVVRAALAREARLMAGIRHPNIVSVHDWREDDRGVPYLVLQYVEGGSLEEKAEARPLGWADAARYVADVCEGLLKVHDKGLVHRDIKPANILWDSASDEALLTDFGLSSHLRPAGSSSGTPPYMPPEGFSGTITPAFDVFSLAVTLFRLVTGELPFPTINYFQRFPLIDEGLPDPDPRLRGMPEPLEALIRAGLKAEPAARPTLREFVQGLRGALNQLQADAMASPSPSDPSGPADLQIRVSLEDRPGHYRPMAPSPSTIIPRRDMKVVPMAPPLVALKTGDRVRVEAVSDRPGYLAVFNIGPSGNLHLLHPDDPAGGDSPPIEAGRPIRIIDVEMCPPAGPERLIAVWSREAMPIRPEMLARLASGDPATSRPYQATRDMKKIRASVEAIPPGDRSVVCLNLDHRPA